MFADYAKSRIRLSIEQLQKILNHPKLDFKTIVSTKTGELSNTHIAEYKGLKFKHFTKNTDTPLPVLTIEGSLHKFWNDGLHNYNDFGIYELSEVLTEIEDEFGINPSQMELKKLELGINIKPPVSSKEVLRSCLLHKTKELKNTFVNGDGNYKQAKYRDKVIKLYDKMTQYKSRFPHLREEILRFEIKYLSMRSLYKLNIRTLYDLLHANYETFKAIMLEEWRHVLMFDQYAMKITDKNYYLYSNVNYWADLKRSNFKYHRDNLNRIIMESPNSLKMEISELISLKMDELTNPSQIAV